MTEVCRKMSNDNEDDSAAKCRERRRRRIEMRRLAAISTTRGSPQPTYTKGSKERSQATGEGSSSSTAEGKRVVETVSEIQTVEPVFGSMSVSGRSSEMEDAISVRTSFCLPGINRRRPLHLFGVYDGHGGYHVAALCRQKMHVLIEEELERVESKCVSGEGGEFGAEWEEMWRGVMKRSYERMDEVAMSTCACGSEGFQCECHPTQMILGGSTAVVAVLTPEHIIVANCGDSRAVLSRGGRAIPLSVDHKPDRQDELARIEAAGGRVIYLDGARVEGILAMSRAIGDEYLKPFVIPAPDITFTKRESEDDCLLLASDGLWDVLSGDLACKVARQCLREENHPVNAGPPIKDEGAGSLYPSRSMLAAALLTRLALGRRSCDNISVIVVDLKSN
ncbi:PREDICTED: probable protein phosphatase 2C 75 [Populus euphratica]|uniref:protein-serine/threonine phosphatase n=1 Tax=Populus euphratica TaxID=75702 RepID=A0AAJ6V4H0_POPEU|nr:PREDICTED: probable protein phosphatase 2C 75 [Populus euphratica]XP_011041659.1 PREDICTED: probable protein phosphatase 2C 75 [Populus euphratica]